MLGFIPITFASVKGAYTEALAKAPGTDTLLRYEERTNLLLPFLIFYLQQCVEVHGYAVSSKDVGTR